MTTKDIHKAVKLLKQGELVGMPTETVYGLAADANNPKAIKKIFALKGRPINHPLILHIENKKQLLDWVEFIPESANKLIKAFWPGPMALIFPAKKNVSRLITGGQDTIAIRMPSHPIVRKLLKLFGGPVVAPSANKFGHVSPTCVEHVQSEFGRKLKLILDGGNSLLGIESTIIDVTESPARLLRPGPLSIAKIKKISGVNIVTNKSKKSPRVSGSLKSHYAPKTKVILFQKNIKFKDNAAIMGIKSKLTINDKDNLLIKMPDDPAAYAQILYAVLRELDAMRFDVIYVEVPPDQSKWLAVRDRVTRAAG